MCSECYEREIVFLVNKMKEGEEENRPVVHPLPARLSDRNASLKPANYRQSIIKPNPKDEEASKQRRASI